MNHTQERQLQRCRGPAPPHLVHGRGSVTVLEVDVGMERAQMNDDLLMGLGTGKVEGRPGMEWGQDKRHTTYKNAILYTELTVKYSQQNAI